MRKDTLERHMKMHENKPCSIDVVTEKIEYHSKVDVVALKNKLVRGANEIKGNQNLEEKLNRM